MSYRKDFVHGGERLRVTLRHLEGDRYEVVVGARRHTVRARRQPNGFVAMELDASGDKVVAATAPAGDRLQVRVDGHTWNLEPHRGRSAGASTAGSGVIEAPMTGTVLRIAVELGELVEEGQAVAVLTAMKMEHRLVADVAGRVVEVGAADGENVDQGVTLIRIDAATD